MEPTGAAPLRPTDAREIGPYRLLGRLGEGGMGTVFLARAPTGRNVAVKVIKSEFANQEGFAARFHAEVDSARRVASFCTAQVLDNGNTADGRPYMVTEYIAGIPLSEQIAKFGGLDPGPLHGVALGVAAALAAIHVSGLVHRDLKPANVILSLSGPRVIDFGIARALDRDSGFTMSGELLGSPGWWAPEQVRGLVVTPAADIFAWGCLVAYAGSGRHPFGRGDAVTLATRVLNSPPDLGALPAPLNELVRQATDMEPLRRPTAQDLVIALVGGASPTIIQQQAADPATEILSQTWEPPQNVVDSTVTGPTPTPFKTAKNAIYAEDTEDTESAKKRGNRWLIAAGAALLALAVTAAILITARTPGSVRPQPSAATSEEAQAPNDIGHRFSLSEDFDGVQLVVSGRPECGVSDYQGTKQTKGQLCVVRWTMLNPGGELEPLTSPTVTLVDDRGSSHDPLDVSTKLPGAIAPGARIEGVYVFDLPPVRKPALFRGTLFQGGKQIEVRL